MQKYPENVPTEYRPMSPWAYVGYNLLFSIPLVGFIVMIVFAFDDSYIVRRNYARSYFCAMLIGLVITLISFIIVIVAFGGLAAFLSSATYSGGYIY